MLIFFASSVANMYENIFSKLYIPSCKVCKEIMMRKFSHEHGELNKKEYFEKTLLDIYKNRRFHFGRLNKKQCIIKCHIQKRIKNLFHTLLFAVTHNKVYKRAGYVRHICPAIKNLIRIRGDTYDYKIILNSRLAN